MSPILSETRLASQVATPLGEVLASRSAESLRTTVLAVWLAALVLIMLTWLHVYVLVTEGKENELVAVKRDLANLARVSEEHANRTFRSADQVVNFVKDRYHDLGSRIDIMDMGTRGVIDVSIFNQVGIINRDGFYAHANRPIPTPLDLSDREHFRVHMGKDTGELFVSKPVMGRATHRWSVQLTRRINKPGGVFDGVVVLSVDAGYFTRFFGDLNLGRKGMAALYGLDGIARARKVGEVDDFGADASGAPMFRLMAEGHTNGSYVNTSVIDGVERIYHYRKLPDYPLAVVIGRDMGEAMSQYTRDRNAFLLQASIVSVLILSLAFAISRFLLRTSKELHRRQEAQLLVMDRTEQLNAIFELSPDGFVTFDRLQRVKYVSPAFGVMTAMGDINLSGLDEREFYAWLMSRCQPGPTGDAAVAFEGAVLPVGSDGTRTFTLAQPAGRVLHMTVSLSKDGPTPKVLCFRDITRETEVAQMKSEFLATAAHELRTPMASVYGFAEVLLNQHELDDATRQEFISIIYNQSQNIAQILDELLDLARIEAQRGKDFKFDRVDCLELVHDTLRNFKCPHGCEAPELLDAGGLSWVIKADRSKLRQALLNVLSNAYKYSPEGGRVTLRLGTRQTLGDSTQVCVTVTDHGIGMTPVQVRRVCERFYRADPSGKLPGSGLGMSIVHEILVMHQGEVDIQSSPGQGTSVSLCLPMAESAGQTSQEGTTEGSEQAGSVA